MKALTNAGKSNEAEERPSSKKAKMRTEDDHSDFVSRCQRARIFAEWIAAKFGLQNRGQIKILDVAGGKGDLAFELAFKFHLKNVTVVDPRDVAFRPRRKYQRKMMKSVDLKDLYHSIPKLFNPEFFKSHPDFAENSLVLGLHPDQATETIVDVGLEFGLCFAVIPCCIFAHENPERRLKNGERPTTYEKYLDYLMEKDPRIQMDSLEFRGRNKVLYFKP